MQLPLLITIKEARKMLGREAKYLSDDQIQEIVAILSLLSKNYIRNNGSKN